MLTVVIIWLYVIATTYLVGYGFLMSLVNWPGMHGKKKSKGNKNYEFRFKESFLITGVVLVTVYAQIISLFSGVGLGANIGLSLICLLISVYYRYEICSDAINLFHRLNAKGNIYIYLAVFLLMAYGTSHGLMHYDSDLYHAQSIHWIEEYGIVKGLGNLHVRFAYNSAAFPLSALYSMSFLGGQSYHVMAGFFALLLAWQCVDIKNVLRRGHFVISDFARVAAIYYLFSIFDEIVSPASDYFLSAMVFYIIIQWLDMYVRHERSYVPYILLALLGIFAITIKLSAAPLILLTIVPLHMLLRNRNRETLKALLISVVLALVIAVPFLARNVIISGWLLYPVTALNLFGVAWKIPKGLAEYDALEIKTFGHGYNDIAAYGSMPMSQWIPNWFAGLTAVSKVMIIMDILAIIIFIVYLSYFVFVLTEEKRGRLKESGRSKIFDISHRSMLNSAEFLTMSATLIGCLLFWFLSAPLIRYGIVYVWLVPAVIMGRLVIVVYNRIGDKIKNVVLKGIVAMFAIWILYKGVFLVVEDYRRFNPIYIVKQQDYGEYATKSFTMGGETIYYPAEGDQIGYHPFPAATHDITGETELMGKEITDGFKAIEK
ncbi:MAG: hypothetical protein IJU77_10860 [Butyrivibrio sp.]|nr:hypothetical protein [Butyrivibrio sp.]